MQPNVTRSGRFGRARIWLVALLVLNLVVATLVVFSSSPTTAQAATYKVLFDNNHAETAGNADWIISTSQPDPLGQNANPTTESSWTGGISAWGVALQKTGRYSLKTLPGGGRITYGDSSNALDLANFNVFVLPEPNILYTSSEKTAIMRFVQNGGGLFMISDHDQSDRNNDGYDSPRILNDLMNNNSVNSDNPFGLQFDILNISTENPSNIPASAANHPVIKGPFGTATGSIIRSGTTATLNTSKNPNAKGLLYRNSVSNTGNTGVFFGVSSFGTGRVASWGDSSPMDDGTGQSGNNLYDGWNDPAGTNAAFALNATEWLAGGGSSGNPTPTPTPTTPGGGGSTQLIANGSFESTASWTQSSSGGYQIIDTTRPRSGSQSAYLCGYNNCTDSIYQTITIPASASSVTLSYYVYISTTETSHAYDFLDVQIRNTGGTVLTSAPRLSDGSTLGSWQQYSLNLNSYKGQTVQICFKSTNGSRNPTDFFVDDVSVLAQ